MTGGERTGSCWSDAALREAREPQKLLDARPSRDSWPRRSRAAAREYGRRDTAPHMRPGVSCHRPGRKIGSVRRHYDRGKTRLRDLLRSPSNDE
jgi:hypothetical protein